VARLAAMLTRPGPKLGTVAIAVSLVAIPATAAEIVHLETPPEVLLPQFYVPYDPKGIKTWPKAPDPQVPGGYTSIGRDDAATTGS
jgi:hypothetical protein